jgi:hypothetical protein
MMSAYVYIKSEPHLFTVGFYDPKGKWHADSDHTDREEAAKRVAYLNGHSAHGFNATYDANARRRGQYEDNK